MRLSTSASQACGSTLLSLAEAISVYIEAARSPPRSEPAKSQFLRPMAMPRSARSAAIGQADAAVAEKAGEGGPALEHVIHGLGDIGMAGQPGPLAAHPVFELADQRCNAGRAHRQALLCRQSIDLALDREDCVDQAHCLNRERRPVPISASTKSRSSALAMAVSRGSARRRWHPAPDRVISHST